MCGFFFWKIGSSITFERAADKKKRPGIVANEQAAKAIEESDKDVDEIGNVLNELKAVADVMGR